MTEKANKPSIRFKGFTDAWELRKVGEVADRYDNLRVPVAANLRVRGNFPYYGANGIQDYVAGYTHDGEFVLVAEDGANDLKNYPVNYVKGRIWVNNHAHVLQGKPKLMDNLFLAYSLHWADISSILVGGSRAKLNANTLMMFELLLPSIDEQSKISESLVRLDNIITLYQRKYDKLVHVKKSLLEKMFPSDDENAPKIRFKGFTDAWQQRKFAEIFNYERPDKYIVTSDKYDDRYETPVLTANKGFILGYTSECRTYDSPCIIFDDFTLDCKHVDFKFMVKSSAMKILTVRNGNNLVFAYERLNTSKIEILAHARHYISVVQPSETLVPKIKEQKKIAKLIYHIDNLITLHQRKLEKLKNIKKALLDKMFV